MSARFRRRPGGGRARPWVGRANRQEVASLDFADPRGAAASRAIKTVSCWVDGYLGAPTVIYHRPVRRNTKLNDWTRIETCLRAEYALKPDTFRQIWGWSTAFREWLDRRGTEARTVEPGDIACFLDQEDWGPGSSKRHQRIWAMRAVAEAARMVTPARARSPLFATAWLDTVAPRSPLGKAISRVLAQAKSEGDRSRWSTALGMYARWCQQQGRAVEDSWLGDVDAFRRDYLATGKTSPGEYGRVAKMLIRELARPVSPDVARPAPGPLAK